MQVFGIDHVQLAMPAGGEARVADRLHTYLSDPFGNRLELLDVGS